MVGLSFLSSSSFLFFLSLLAWLPFCCVAATQQPSNPTSQQHNNPTSQQPNIPTTQQPNNPTTQQPNNPTNNPATQQSSKQKTTQPPNNPTTTQSPTTPSQKNYQSSLFSTKLIVWVVFFASSFYRFFFTIFNHFGELWGASGVLWGPILGVKIEKKKTSRGRKMFPRGFQKWFPSMWLATGGPFLGSSGVPKIDEKSTCGFINWPSHVFSSIFKAFLF